jgi:hypothetical protein
MAHGLAARACGGAWGGYGLQVAAGRRVVGGCAQRQVAAGRRVVGGCAQREHARVLASARTGGGGERGIDAIDAAVGRSGGGGGGGEARVGALVDAVCALALLEGHGLRRGGGAIARPLTWESKLQMLCWLLAAWGLKDGRAGMCAGARQRSRAAPWPLRGHRCGLLWRRPCIQLSTSCVTYLDSAAAAQGGQGGAGACGVKGRVR